MKRTEFVRRSFGTLGALTLAPFLHACSTKTPGPDTGSEAGTGGDGPPDSGSCTLTASETAGPYPTNNPSSLVLKDITSDRRGTPLVIKITIQDKNNNCEALQNAFVDVWHCDAAGNYSEYGGSGMQPANYTGVHFLRGRQTTDENGQVTFTSIYPGWYAGRAPHIHVHVYSAAGKSLLVTQIAFPEAISEVVYKQGVYATRGQADTSNARDGIFRDGIGTELATVTGSVPAGYELTHAIIVNAS